LLPNPLCSVLICTYNRSALLRLTLESLCVQSLDRDKFETIIIDDGSTDETAKVVESFGGRMQIRYEYQRNSGIASARNHGLFLARGNIALFQDDDDIANPELVSEHLRTHALHPEDEVAVLGHTNLTEALAQDPLMHYVTMVDQYLYSYPSIRHGQVLGFSHFWGGRSSCKRKLLLERGVFNPVFRFGCEDIELAFRLSRSGFRVVYNARAISTTFRLISFDDFCNRLFRQGRSGWIFSRMHRDPEVQSWAGVDQVAEWESLKPRYDRLVGAARKADATVRAKRKLDLATDADRPPLFDAYRAAFRASKIKGFAEQAREQEEMRSPGSTTRSAVSATDRGGVNLATAGMIEPTAASSEFR